MPGGFAHSTVAAEAISKLPTINSLTDEQKFMIGSKRYLVEVGSISPDYPYLGMQSDWADLMHYQETGEVIRNGVRGIISAGNLSGSQLAWLFGYASHVAADLTIHPVVELRVGAYAENAKEHRVCEMHQDSYIWQRRNLGELGLSDYFETIIDYCSTEGGELISEISSLWRLVLQMTYPAQFMEDPPELDRWNKGFRTIVGTIDDAGSLFAFSRHLFAQEGLVYPEKGQHDTSYTVALDTPEGQMNYDQVFDRAVRNVVLLWTMIGLALNAETSEETEDILAGMPDGNLDTGRDLSTGQYIFWEAQQ